MIRYENAITIALSRALPPQYDLLSRTTSLTPPSRFRGYTTPCRHRDATEDASPRTNIVAVDAEAHRASRAPGLARCSLHELKQRAQNPRPIEQSRKANSFYHARLKASHREHIEKTACAVAKLKRRQYFTSFINPLHSTARRPPRGSSHSREVMAHSTVWSNVLSDAIRFCYLFSS